MSAKVLVIGDIVGQPGRGIVVKKLAGLIRDLGVDFVVANGENAASGSGITPAHVKELTESGVDVITTGDHIWKRAQITEFISGNVPLLRPANYPTDAAGRGAAVFTARNGLRVGVINLVGRVYMMAPADCPFRTADAAIKKMADQAQLVIVDMHAEATSEKIALGWYLDGRATAVIGTHTHVPTADERILPGGTAYITDVGMTGPYQSVIGRETKKVLNKFITGMYSHFDVASGDVRLCGTLVEADPEIGKALSIERITVRAGE